MLKVSVIVPAYNEEDTIEHCIKSMMLQKYLNLEFVIVAGGSDGTFNIATKYASEKIKVVQQRPLGKGVALNEGLRKASGEIIITTDADCTFPERWIDKLVYYFDDPEVMAVGGGWRATDNSNCFVRLQEANDIYNMRFRSLILIGRNSAFRRCALERLNGFEENLPFGEDRDITTRLIKENMKILFRPEILVYTEYPLGIMEFIKQQIRWARNPFIKWPTGSSEKKTQYLKYWRYLFSFVMIFLPFLSIFYTPIILLWFFLLAIHILKQSIMLWNVKEFTKEREYFRCFGFIIGIIFSYYLAHIGAVLYQIFGKKSRGGFGQSG